MAKWLVVSVAIMATVIVSCRTMQNETKISSSGNSQKLEERDFKDTSWWMSPFHTMGQFMGALKSSKTIDVYKYYRDGNDSTEKSAVVLGFFAENCTAKILNSTKQKWKLSFHSIFGPHEAYLFLKDGGAEILLDDRKQVFLKFDPITETEFPEYCARLDRGETMEAYRITEQIEKKLVRWLSLLASDCSMKWMSGKGWQCEFENVEPSLASSELESIHKMMVNRWSRQPYLFSRRLAITKNLAEILQSQNLDSSSLDAFCRVISFSMPSELPIALASPVWQERVCKSPDSKRQEFALLGLSKALSEIDFLRMSFEQNSRLGILAVRIPKNQSPSKDLWVSLQPINSNNVSEQNIPGCWHPLFAKSEKALMIARKLDLLNEAPNQACDKAIAFGDQRPDVLLPNPERYVSASITSETEFVVTNGQSKLLRLPLGNYSYIIRPHSDALDELETDPNVQPSTGTIEWNQKKPQVTIQKW